VHLGVLDEQTSRDVLLHLLPGHEVVVHALLLAGSWLASRVRDGEAELVWELGRQLLDESGLAYAAGPCHDASTSHTRRGPPHCRNLRLGFHIGKHLLREEAPELHIGLLDVLVEPSQRQIPSLWHVLVDGQLPDGSVQPLLDPLFCLCPPPSQSLLQHLRVRRSEEDKRALRGKGTLPQCVCALHVDVQQTDLAFVHD